MGTLIKSDWNQVVEDKASRPRPAVFKAKAKATCLLGQGRDFLSSSCPRGRGQSLRTPSLITAEDVLTDVSFQNKTILSLVSIFLVITKITAFRQGDNTSARLLIEGEKQARAVDEYPKQLNEAWGIQSVHSQ